MDKLDKEDFNECVATMAVFAYAVADLEERLPDEIGWQLDSLKPKFIY
ncbi:hypothetical protein [Rhodohalobacter sp.]|nr:hypothetical protein [Rhodohalobacter sp.]MDZ7756036.1 hypothetical protein [Rhodohalobacter sp.]